MDLNARYARFAVATCAVMMLFMGILGAAQDQERVAREARLIEILKSGAPDQEKDQACRELQVIGTPASIPALATLLADKDLSHMARYALEPMPYPQAGQALREALPHTSSLTQIGIINSLGFRREREAAPELIKLLTAPDVGVLSAAAAALGRIATPEAVLALEKFRGTAAVSLRAVAAEASLTAAERMLHDGRQAAAVKIYEQMQIAKWPVHVRQGAFAGLLAALPNEAAARIARAVKENDAIFKAVAISGIPALKDPGAAEQFSAMLPKASPDTQVLLIGALADCESKSTLPAIHQALSSRNQDVKLAAIKALDKAGDASSVGPLARILSEPNTDAMKKEASGSLGRLRGEGVNAELRAILKTAPADVKVMLIGIMASRWATEAWDDLLAEARSGDLPVRQAALKPLGNWGGGEHLPAILEILTEWQGEEGRSEVEAAATKLARKISNSNAQADAVLAALNAAAGTPLKCSLLRVLGGIANGKALDAMRTALGSGVPEVKETALDSLIAWPDSRAIDLLLGEWRTSSNPTQKTLILRGCVRLLRLGEGPTSQAVGRYKDLLDGAQSPEDKMLVLSGLAEVADPAALEVVEPSLGDPQVKAEAEWSMIQAARNVMGSDPQAAKKAAGELATGARSEEVRKQAVDMVRQIAQSEDYLMTWQVAGPNVTTRGDELQLFDAVFPAETAHPDVQWQDLPIKGRTARPWMLDLAGFLKGARMRAAYARTWIYSETAQSASMELGVDDPVKVWLNNQIVHLHNIPTSSGLVKDEINISLRQGWNMLVLKILQTDGPWEFSVRLRKPNGEPLDGVRYDADYGEQASTAQKMEARSKGAQSR